MDPKRLDRIKEQTEWAETVALMILEGERDNYDGVVVARVVYKLCGFIKTLLAEMPHGEKREQHAGAAQSRAVQL